MKKSQIDTENDKNSKTFQFSKFLFFFSEFSTDSENWNDGKGQQGENVLFNLLGEEINAVFQMKVVWN